MTDPIDALIAQHGGVAVGAPAPEAPAAAVPAGVDLDALIAQHGGVPASTPRGEPVAHFTQSDTSPNDVEPNTFGTLASHLWSAVNPLNVGQLLPWPKAWGGSGVDNPLNPKTILDKAAALREEGNAAWSKGDKTRALAKYFDSLLPIIGPIASHVADDAEKGKYMAALGDFLGVVGPAAVGAIGKIPSPVKALGGGWTPEEATANAAQLAKEAAKRAGRSSTLTAEEQAANDFAEARGVPLDAATKTGSPFVRGVQKVAGESMLGSGPASAARAGQAEALGRVGGEIADQVHPVATTPEQAGAGVPASIRSTMAELHAEANRQYGTVRAEEAKPENVDTIPLPAKPVDSLRDWQRGELRRIVHEMDASGYVSQNYTHEGEYTPRSGGAQVYHDITERLGHESLDRGEVQEQLESYLAGGKKTAAVDAALDVAKARQMGSRKISTPEMPVSMFTVPTKLEAARQMSAQMPMAVDMTDAKAAIEPIYTRLKREAELAPLMGGKAEALRALDRLMTGPDHAPLSVAEGALGDIKTIARSDDPLLRTAGQGVAGKAAQALGEAINLRAAGAGDVTYDALHAGRAATRGKYAAADVLEGLRAEPVKVYQQLTAPKDAGIEQLREVAKAAPDSMASLGRAKLEEMLGRATERGRFDHADALYADWQKLGPETKKILFKDPAVVEALDKFFLLAKRIGENPNPSGTAPTLVKTAEVTGATAALFSGHPLGALGSIASSVTMGGLAKLMYSPRGIRALTRVLETSPGGIARSGATVGRAAAQAAWLDLGRAGKAVGVALPAQAAERDETP